MAELPIVDPNNIENFSKPCERRKRVSAIEKRKIFHESQFYNDCCETKSHDGISDSRIEVRLLQSGESKYLVQLRDPKDHDYYIRAFFTSIAYVVLTLGLGLFFLHRFLYNFKWKTGSEHETEAEAKFLIDDYISKRKEILKDRFDKKVKSTKYIKYP